MRLALFGKAVLPDDAEALRQSLERVLQLDPQPWMHLPYMSELGDHMEVPSGFRAFEGDVPEDVDVLLAFGGDGTVPEGIHNGSTWGNSHSWREYRPAWISEQCEHGSF